MADAFFMPGEQPVFGLVGSGSWGTALAKILTDNGHSIHWYVRGEDQLKQLANLHHNPKYLKSVTFDGRLLHLTSNPTDVFAAATHVILAVPSSFVLDILEQVEVESFIGKRIISAIKGIPPQDNLLLNDHLKQSVGLAMEDYFTIMGPCHAEEVAAEKLSYLTFSGVQEADVEELASHFRNRYINTVVNTDVYGVQYAAILKNIYALGAGIAHGLGYGDNFGSVFVANAADEMAGFLRHAGILHVEVGVHERISALHKRKSPNYAASVYLGDLLVTCYSEFSRNRTFGDMIGKGFSVQEAERELNMIAEGFNASRCIHVLNEHIGADMPIAETVFNILWKGLTALKGFKQIEEALI